MYITSVCGNGFETALHQSGFEQVQAVAAIPMKAKSGIKYGINILYTAGLSTCKQ